MWVTGIPRQQLYTGLCRVAHSDWTCPVTSSGVHAPGTTLRSARSPTSGKWGLTSLVPGLCYGTLVLTWRCPDLAWTCLYMLACLGLSIVCWHELGYTWVEPLILLSGAPDPAGWSPWSCWWSSLILLMESLDPADGVSGPLLDEVIGTVIVRDTTRSPTVLQWYHLQSTLNSIFVFQKWIETLSLITRYNSANTICTSRPPWQVLYKLTTPSL